MYFLCSTMVPQMYALAYIDPGTGSLILQALLAMLAGGLLMLKMFWRRIKAFFSKQTPPEKEADKNEPAPDQADNEDS